MITSKKLWSISLALFLLYAVNSGVGVGKIIAPLIAVVIFANAIVISRRPKFSFLVVLGVFAFIIFGNYYKRKYLEAPLLGMDFTFFFETFRANFEVFLNYRNVLFTLLTAFLVVVGTYVLLWRQEQKMDWRLRHKGYTMVIAAVLLVDFGLAQLPHWLRPRSDAQANEQFQWRIAGKVRFSLGPVTDFFYSFAQIGIEDPDVESASYFRSKQSQLARSLPKALPARRNFPNIFFWLEESTFDPKILTACDQPVCESQMFKPNEHTYSSGPLRVHVAGAGTWTSEFSALVGVDHRLFGPGAYYTNYTLAPKVRESLPKYLKSLGYRTIAVYPVNGFFLNAEFAYKQLGFDAFYDSKKLGIGSDWYQVPDQKMFELANEIQAKESSKGQPVFVMLLTIKNHGPHFLPANATLPATFEALNFSSLNTRENSSLVNYLYRFQESDATVVRANAHYFSRATQGGRSAVFGYFGDHQPMFDGRLREFPKRMAAGVPDTLSNFITGYAIGTNVPSVKKGSTPAFPFLDISYLSVQLLDAAGLPKSPYFKALSDLRDLCHGAFMECSDQKLLRSYLGYVFNDLGVIDR